MLKAVIRTIIMLAAAILLQGCLYTKIQMPMDRDFDSTNLGSKEGRSDIKSVLYLVSWGDGGTRAAAEQGSIKTITHADREVFSIFFGSYTRITTIVYGD